MEQAESKSHKSTWIVVAVVGVFLVVLAMAAVLMAQFGAKDGTTKVNSSTGSSNTKNVTKETIEQNIKDVADSIKQAKTDQEAVKAALNDDAKRVKLDD